MVEKDRVAGEEELAGQGDDRVARGQYRRALGHGVVGAGVGRARLAIDDSLRAKAAAGRHVLERRAQRQGEPRFALPPPQLADQGVLTLHASQVLGRQIDAAPVLDLESLHGVGVLAEPDVQPLPLAVPVAFRDHVGGSGQADGHQAAGFSGDHGGGEGAVADEAAFDAFARPVDEASGGRGLGGQGIGGGENSDCAEGGDETKRVHAAIIANRA